MPLPICYSVNQPIVVVVVVDLDHFLFYVPVPFSQISAQILCSESAREAHYFVKKESRITCSGRLTCVYESGFEIFARKLLLF